MIRLISLLLALVLLTGVIVVAIQTRDQQTRWGERIQTNGAVAPDDTCASGYDGGYCVLTAMKGGVHSFLLPGVLAALISVTGGAMLGMALASHNHVVQRLARALDAWLDSFPRIVMMYLAYVLSDHSLYWMGCALGVLSIPALSAQVKSRIDALSQTDFIQSSRAHGLTELYITFRHILGLSCRGDLLRHGATVFGGLIMVQTSLAYALGVSGTNLSNSEASWGYLLKRTTPYVYSTAGALGDALLATGSMAVTGPFSLFLALRTGLERSWTAGLSQCLTVSMGILGVLWACHTAVTHLAAYLERER